MSEASNSNPFLPKAVIAVLVLIIAYLFFFNNGESETPKKNSVLTSDTTTDKLSEPAVKDPTSNNTLDEGTRLELLKLIRDSTVFIAIDQNGNQQIFGNDLKPGDPCTPGLNLENDQASRNMKKCAAFNKDSQLLSAVDSTVLTSKGSYIITQIINGVARQFCYNDSWVRTTCL